MRLFLVRHGQTAWNAGLRAQGHSDIPLDETGARQAANLAESLAGETIEKVISSDLARAADTGRAVAERLGIPLILDRRLRERSYGAFEGMSFAQLSASIHQQRHIQGLDNYEVRPPNGESLEDVWVRLKPLADEMFLERQDVLVVGHGGCCALLLARLMKGSIYTSRSFRFANTGLTELALPPEGDFKLIRYNDASHLVDERPLTGSIDGASR
jgi:2,3-bisphosphoglycerate-dependent phosphoglycerate mutase